MITDSPDTNNQASQSRPGGGSQDSIDSYITQIIDDYLVYLKELGKNHEDAVKATVEYDRPDLLAWHNTQLKAVLQSLRKDALLYYQHVHDISPDTKTEWAVPMEAIDNMQSSLEQP